ncbi:MAG: hypothetical protein Q8P12_07560 [bacterium]|nr:hypothetical protein [bacterium]
MSDVEERLSRMREEQRIFALERLPTLLIQGEQLDLAYRILTDHGFIWAKIFEDGAEALFKDYDALLAETSLEGENRGDLVSRRSKIRSEIRELSHIMGDESFDHLMREAKSIPVLSLEGRRIFTIGKRFYGLGTRRFRRLLRQAGASIEPRARKSTDLIMVGEDPSRSSILGILLTLSEKSRPPFVKEGPFLVRFGHQLRHLEVSGGQTFQNYLERNLREQ